MQIPVGVGFCIREAASARAVGKVADAVVIGTRLIQLLEAAPPDQVVPAAADFIKEIRAALDEVLAVLDGRAVLPRTEPSTSCRSSSPTTTAFSLPVSRC